MVLMTKEEITVSQTVQDVLNKQIASWTVLYVKLHNYHWYVKGSQFFTLHVKFEELYTNAVTTIDELAERILTLGKAPVSTYQEYINNSRIKEIKTEGVEDLQLVNAILDDFSTLIEIEREIMETTAKNGDDGTNDMINKFMQFKEKNTWMLRAFCGKS